MSFIFKLHLEKETSKLTLLDGNEEVTSREWPESRDMGRRLFEAIDGLLAEAWLKPEDVRGFEIESELHETATSNRIAETVQRVYTFVVSANNRCHPESGEQPEK